MQSTLRVMSMLVRGSVRGAFTRSGLWRKLSTITLLCALCLVFYYNRINSTRHINTSRKYLVAVSDLPIFTAISRRYSERNDSSLNDSIIRLPVPFNTVSSSSMVDDVQTVTVTSTWSESVETTIVPAAGKRGGEKSRKSRLHYPEIHSPPRVLVLYGYRPSTEIRTFLEAYRVSFIHSSLTKARYLLSDRKNDDINLSQLALVVIVADLRSTLAQPYIDFCRERSLPIIWAVSSSYSQPPGGESYSHLVPHVDTAVVRSESIIHVALSKTYPFHYSRPGAEGGGAPSGKLWTTFTLNSSNVGYTNTQTSNSSLKPPNSNGFSDKPIKAAPVNADITHNYRTLVEVGFITESASFVQAPAVMEDLGEFDGVRKILFGTPLRFWLSHLMLLDALHVLCEGVELVRGGRERMVMVDIDDIFLAPEGTRMTKDDVQALLRTQAELRSLVPGFTFNAGFVGGYYDVGPEEEKLGNQELVRNADKLWWFGHTFKHQQPHKMTPDDLLSSMQLNQQFAKEHGIQGSLHHYSVAPHHSGVYPVYTPLYDAWREVWNVTVTTTEEYPGLKPDHRRRGFKFKGISVLPRQTCRLFTHTYLTSHFSGGREEVVAIARGGEVFMTLLRNPVVVFMTHTPNYCCDRLALILLPSLFLFTSQWTQLELTTPTPEIMARRYFSLYPEDETPLWTSPCDDNRHLEIWPVTSNCSRLPSLLILGPQKSGSTALYSFLRQHPLLISNRDTELHYEEVQFFSDESLYQLGIDWYMDQFPYPPSPPPSPSPSPPPPSSPIIFDKSATYLTHPLGPLRASSLLPRARLVVILADPAKRAYSWYQHQRAHSDPTALQYTFSEVLQASSPSSSSSTPPPSLTSLSHHCLSPAHYHQHISLWLQYYDPEQLLLVDGDDLVESPAEVMDSVLEFLLLPFFPYYNILQYDERKGFYCIIEKNGRRKCLGKSKGRSYPPMTPEDHQWLASYYTPHNTQLRDLLTRLDRPAPRWLLKAPENTTHQTRV